MKTSFSSIIRKEHKTIEVYLRNSHSISSHDYLNNTPLHLAVYGDDEKAVKIF